MYNTQHADETWSREADKNANEVIITGTGDNQELYEQSALENISMMKKWRLINKNYVTLHVGCGNGRIEKHLSKIVKKCYGVDVSTSMIKLANERCSGIDNTEFIKCTGFDLSDIGDKTIDFAYSFFVFQHMPRQCVINYMLELNRVLKSGSKFLCQFQLLGVKAIESPKYSEPEEDHASAIRLYSIENLENLANNSGFEIFDIKERVQAELDSKRRIWDCNIYTIFKKT